jgi:predicted O-methyltransferase YrrM
MSPSEPSTPDAATFDQLVRTIEEVQGWLTAGQVRLLWESARAARPGGSIVEIGSFQGRSTIVLATAAPPDVEVVAIDPHGGTDRGPEEYVGYEAEGQHDFVTFHANLERAGVADRVRHVRAPSHAAHAEVDGPIDLLFIDGAHRFPPARADIHEWGARVADGGTLLVHDSYGAIGVTLALAFELWFSGRFRYVGRSNTLTEYRREDLTVSERAANAARQAAELPYLAYNLLLKVMIVAGLKRYTRYLGHPSGEWPH